MTPEGIGAGFIETHARGKAAKLFPSPECELVFCTGHDSRRSRAETGQDGSAHD